MSASGNTADLGLDLQLANEIWAQQSWSKPPPIQWSGNFCIDKACLRHLIQTVPLESDLELKLIKKIILEFEAKYFFQLNKADKAHWNKLICEKLLGCGLPSTDRERKLRAKLPLEDVQKKLKRHEEQIFSESKNSAFEYCKQVYEFEKFFFERFDNLQRSNWIRLTNERYFGKNKYINEICKKDRKENISWLLVFFQNHFASLDVPAKTQVVGMVQASCTEMERMTLLEALSQNASWRTKLKHKWHSFSASADKLWDPAIKGVIGAVCFLVASYATGNASELLVGLSLVFGGWGLRDFGYLVYSQRLAHFSGTMEGIICVDPIEESSDSESRASSSRRPSSEFAATDMPVGRMPNLQGVFPQQRRPSQDSSCDGEPIAVEITDGTPSQAFWQQSDSSTSYRPAGHSGTEDNLRRQLRGSGTHGTSA